ncbi:MAG: tail fiber domain-containing protein, partial [Chloroflexi bacterium]|nr:tail fiber domain-containing protein [Chloroflexota bacterium]
SDIRLKRAIAPLAKLESGLQLYRFQYLWSDDVFVGVMAQDLLANPQWQDAVVVQKNGFYAVNYEHLGIRMVSLAEWNHQGIHALVLAPALALAH